MLSARPGSPPPDPLYLSVGWSLTDGNNREIMFLQELGGHENIIKLLKVIKADNDRDIYLVFEYMGTYHTPIGTVLSAAVGRWLIDVRAETDLHEVIRAKILEDVHKQYIIYQLLKALKYMHSGDVLHRDMKVLRTPRAHASHASL